MRYPASSVPGNVLDCVREGRLIPLDAGTSSKENV